MKEKTSYEELKKRPEKSDQQPESSSPSKGVFIQRAKGQSFEEFREFCIKRFREAGLIKD